MTGFGARCGGVGGGTEDSIPRGGPIFVPNMVSPLTRVSTFESCVIQELHNLQTCLISDAIEEFDDELSVDELKVVTEEELAVKALEEVFKDDGSLNDSSSVQNINGSSARRSERINRRSRGNEVRENCGEDLYDEVIVRKSKRIEEKRRDKVVPENCVEDFGVAEQRKMVDGESCNGEDQQNVAGNLEVEQNVSVDELKVVTEEELAVKAIEEVFKDDGSLNDSSSVQNINGSIARRTERINRRSRGNEVRENCGEDLCNEVIVRRSKRIKEKRRDKVVTENCVENLGVAEERKSVDGESCNCEDHQKVAGNLEVVEIRERTNGNSCNGEDGENCAGNLEVVKNRNRVNGHSCTGEDQEDCEEKVRIPTKRKRGKNCDVGNQGNSAEKAEVSKEKKGINGESHNGGDQDTCAGKLKIMKKSKRMKGSNLIFEGFDAKMEPFLKIKQKQEEEKAAARLHSFNGSLQKTNECGNKSLDDTERMTSLRSIDDVIKVNTLNCHGDYVPVVYPEVVLCIEVYNNKNHIRMKTQEFLVLGCQFLSELRDKIHCLTDLVMQKAGQHDPSGYFLIEDVFCNDMRDANAIDYSEPILDWLRNSKDEAIAKWECILSGQLQKKQKALLGDGRSPNLPCFRAVEMQKMRFCDLSFRVGAGYLYCHQGDCKHIIVVRDMRLIHPNDVQNRRVYPIVTFHLRERLQKCSVCKISIAEKVTVDDKWAAENPCYFCKNCYYMLHYVDGSLLYEGFSVHDYIHD